MGEVIIKSYKLKKLYTQLAQGIQFSRNMIAMATCIPSEQFGLIKGIA